MKKDMKGMKETVAQLILFSSIQLQKEKDIENYLTLIDYGLVLKKEIALAENIQSNSSVFRKRALYVLIEILEQLPEQSNTKAELKLKLDIIAHINMLKVQLNDFPKTRA